MFSNVRGGVVGRIMNSKAVKWFIRHTGIRKTDEKADETGKKKSSFFKERSETLRKYSLTRLSLRKRHKRRDQSTSKEKTRSNSYSRLDISPVIDTDTKLLYNKVAMDQTNSNYSETCLRDSKNNKLVKHFSADSSFNLDTKDAQETETCKRSSMSLPENFAYGENVHLEGEDTTETSELEGCSSASVETVKRVDNLDEDSYMDCPEIVNEGDNESLNNGSGQPEITHKEEKLASDVSNSNYFKKSDASNKNLTILDVTTNPNSSKNECLNHSLENEKEEVIQYNEYNNNNLVDRNINKKSRESNTKSGLSATDIKIISKSNEVQKYVRNSEAQSASTFRDTQNASKCSEDLNVSVRSEAQSSKNVKTNKLLINSEIEKASVVDHQKTSTDNKTYNTSIIRDQYFPTNSASREVSSNNETQKVSINNNTTHESLTIDETRELPIESENIKMIKNAVQISNQNGSTEVSNGDLEEVFNYQHKEPRSKTVSDLKESSGSCSSSSLSNSLNETIAIFDDDGDISAISPTVENETSISKSKKIIENNVKQLKKLKFLCRKNIESNSSVCTPTENFPRQCSSKGVLVDEDISKVKIVITQPSPEKSATTAHSQLELPVQSSLTVLSREHYPEELNPFGDDDDDQHKPESQTSRQSLLHKSNGIQRNPFGSDSENEALESHNFNSRQRESRQNTSELIKRKGEYSDNSNNPFAIYEDLENSRLSTSNPFAEDSDEMVPTTEKYSHKKRISTEDTPPSLPPKLDYRMRQGSLSSAPIPHPRKSKQYHHGSAISLNSNIFPPVPYPRSCLPSTSSETLNSTQECEERSNFVRGRDRSSLPASSQVRLSKKKRIAPRPPNQIQTQRSLSSDRPRSEDYKLKGKSYSMAESPQTNQPPPRPPPPKTQLKNYQPTIKEKFLRII